MSENIQILQGATYNLEISEIDSNSLGIVHTGDQNRIQVSESKDLSSFQIIQQDDIPKIQVSGQDCSIRISKEEYTGKIALNEVGVNKIDVHSTASLVFVPTDTYIPGLVAYLESSNDISQIYIGDDLVYHQGNANKSDVDWTMKDAFVYGDLEARGSIASESFSEGFGGSGFKISDDSGVFTLTVDNLNVRRKMSAYEMVINQIRGGNGAFLFSDSARIKSVDDLGTTYKCWTDTDTGNISMPYQADDIIICQKWNGSGTKYYAGKVTAVGTGYFILSIIDGTDEPEAGDETARIGNETDTDRQGSVYITSNDTNAPYIDVYDGVTDESLSGHIKARLGKLTGIVDADLGTLSGYGLYSENVYLKGKIVATSGEFTGTITSESGEIGGWTIDEDAIYTGSKHTDDGYSASGITLSADGSIHGETFYIDSDGKVALKGDGTNSLSMSTDDGLTMYASSVLKFKIHTGNIASASVIASGIDISYTGSAAGTYTGKTLSTSSGSVPQELDDSVYLQEDATSSTTLKVYDTLQADTYSIETVAGVIYDIKMYANVDISYTLRTNRSTSDLNTDPDTGFPITPSEGDQNYTTTNTLSGNYQATITTKLFDADDNLLFTELTRRAVKTADDLNFNIFNSAIKIPTDTAYFTLDYEITHNLQNKETRHWYEFNGFSWVPLGSLFDTDEYYYLATNYKFDIESLSMDGSHTMMEIGKDGLTAYYDTDKYFSINASNANTEAAPFMESSGVFKHHGKVFLDIPITGSISSPQSDGAVNINTNTSAYAMTIYNDGNNANRSGIKMRIGADTPDGSNDNEYIWAEDGNGTVVGTLYNKGSGLAVYAVSDERVKENIVESEADALSVLNGIRVRKYDYIKGSKNITGYIAQELQGIQDAVIYNENADVYMMDSTKLIPYLHKAILELQSQIKTFTNEKTNRN